MSKKSLGLFEFLIALPFMIIWYMAKVTAGLVFLLGFIVVRLVKLQMYKKKAVEIATGKNLTLAVYGEHYAQDKSQLSLLWAKFSRQEKFSLTIQSQYQLEHRWPEPPFANVNLYGSTKTTKFNWFGYISPLPPLEEDDDTAQKAERRKYIKKLIEINKKVPLVVHGKIIDERSRGGSMQIILFASRKSIDEAYAKYVEGTKV